MTSQAPWGTVLLLMVPAVASGQQITVAGRACHSVTPPKTEAVVDRKLAERELRSAVGDSLAGQVLMSITYGPTGAPLQVRSLASNLDSTLIQPLLTAVATGLKDLPDGRVPGTRLLLTLGQPIGLQTEPASYCPPTRLTVPSAERTEILVTTTEPMPSTVRIPGATLTIGIDGSVEEVVLERNSGVRDIDEAQIRRMRAWTFLPAVVDGLPVRVQISAR